MKPACIPPVINDTCIDPTPDGVTCFSYSHCLNVRSGQYYNNATAHPKCPDGYYDIGDACQSIDACNPVNYAHGDTSCLDHGGTNLQPKTLPRTGSNIEILLPIICSIVAIILYKSIKKLFTFYVK